MPIKKLIVTAVLASTVALGPQMAVAAVANLPDFTQLVQDEGRAVVNISTKQTVSESVAEVPDELAGDPFFEFFRRFAPRQQREFQATSLGSGFILSKDGYVLTNSHVVAKADEITVKLTDKREFKAKLIGSDARTDVALLKIDGAGNLPVIRVGDDNALKVGEWVVAIGSPFGFDNSVTAGIVSAKGRQLPDENYVPFIQTDAAVNPGNSGGPLFNMNGEVVGINSQIYSRSGGFMGISFAIPIDVAMNVADQLKAKGRVSRGRIGVTTQEVSKALATSFGLAQAHGALVTNVEKGAPADKAGLKPGDILLKVDGQAIQSGGDLQRAIGAITPGKPVTLEVWRNRASRNITVVAAELKDSDPRVAARETNKPKAAAPAEQAMSQVGLVVSELSAQQLRQAGVPFGLLVQRANQAAQRAGVLAGDVIVGVGSEQLSNAKQLFSEINSAKKGSSVALQVLRQGATLFVALPVGESS